MGELDGGAMSEGENEDSNEGMHERASIIVFARLLCISAGIPIEF